MTVIVIILRGHFLSAMKHRVSERRGWGTGDGGGGRGRRVGGGGGKDRGPVLGR